MNDPHTVHTIKRLLDQSTQQTPPHIQARLNQAIIKAVALHNTTTQTKSIWPNIAQRSLQQLRLWGETLASAFNRPRFSLAFSMACVVLAVGAVVQVAHLNHDTKSTETADLEAAILLDDLPPDAYLDGGFIEFSTQHPKKQSLPNDDSLDEWLRTINSGEQPQTSI